MVMKRALTGVLCFQHPEIKSCTPHATSCQPRPNAFKQCNESQRLDNLFYRLSLLTLLNPLSSSPSPPPNRILRWLLLGLLFPVVILNGWLFFQTLHYFQPLISIFVGAAVLAFILNYPVHFLQHYGLKRLYAVLTVSAVTLVVFLTVGFILLPILIEDISEIIRSIPTWFESGSQQLQFLQNWALSRRIPFDLQNTILQVANSLPNQIDELANQFFSFTLETIGGLSQAALTAVVTFYLLLDGEQASYEVFRRLPVSVGSKVQKSLTENFQNYFIGQVAIASLLGVLVATAFVVLQVPFPLLCALSIALAALIPFADVVVYLVIVTVLALQDPWLALRAIAITVLIDQVVDQVVAPRLLGSFTGLKPIWVIAAIIVGAKFGGLLGLAIAVPLASFAKSALDGFSEYADEEAIAPPEASKPAPDSKITESSSGSA